MNGHYRGYTVSGYMVAMYSQRERVQYILSAKGMESSNESVDRERKRKKEREKESGNTIEDQAKRHNVK